MTFTKKYTEVVGEGGCPSYCGIVLAILGALVLTAALPVRSLAQRLGGTLQVEVTDKSGGTVPGAKVTATNEGTKVITNATSSGDIYVFPDLLPGPYTVEVTKEGFNKYVRAHVNVLPNQTVDAPAALEVGSLTTTVEVTAEGEAPVQVTSSQIQSGFTGSVAEQLPINTIGGDVKELAVVLPNTTTQPGGINGSGGSIAGLRPRYNSFTIDGADDNSIVVNGNLTPVIEDSVADFSVLTSQFSAEYGHSAAGIFTITTKSGTNNFHGEAHEYNRNRDYNGLDNLQAQRGSKDPYDYNRAGASLGGPIVKDRLFFFGAYEYQNEHRLFSGPTLETPTAAGLATLKTMAHDPAVVAVLNQFAVAQTANGVDLNTGVPVGVFQGVAPNFTHQHDFIISLDGNVGKHSIRGRYIFDRERQPELQLSEPLAQFTGTQNNDARKVILEDVWAISPTLVNDFRFAFSRAVGPQLVVPAGFENFPNVEIDDLGINIGPNGCSPQTTIINTYQWSDSVTKTFGKHTVKVGAEVRNYISPSNFLPRARGEWDYTTLSVFINDQIPEGLNGDLRGAGSGFFAGDFKSYYGFGQDDWKITPRLTVNLGLRYEFNGIARDEALQNLNAIANDPALGLIFRTPKPDKRDWAPRLGFAYDPTGSGKWAIRGGAGYFYDIYPLNFPELNLPPQLQTQQSDSVTCALPGAPPWCTDITKGFLQTGGLLQVNVPPTNQADARTGTQGMMVDVLEPRILSWSLSVQHELKPSTTVELRYLGNHAVHLPGQVRLTQNSAFDPRFPGGGVAPLPTYFSAASVPATVTSPASTLASFKVQPGNPLIADGFGDPFTILTPISRSVYHGGSVTVTHHFTHGLYAQADYTFARVEDANTAELFSTRLNPRRAQDGLNYQADWGPSALDIRNKFAMAVTYNIPNVKVSNAFARGFLHDWEWITTYLAQSGQPITALSGVDSNFNGDKAGDRAIFNPNGAGQTGTTVNVVCNDGVGGATRIVATAAACSSKANVVGYVAKKPGARYVQAGPGAQATLGRNTIPTPGLNIWNMSVLKNIVLTERYRLQFRVATYNTFNHPNPSIGLPTNNGTIDSNQNSNPLSTTYNLVTSPLFLDSSEFNAGSRRMELGLKVIF
jgi:carboxypeptidase family protein/TonB-dependent receptor-like protein